MADVNKFKTVLIDDEDAFATANADDDSALGLAVIDGSVEENFTREVLEEDSVVMDHGRWTPYAGSSKDSMLNFSCRCGGVGDLTDPVDGVLGAEDTETPVRTAFLRLVMSLFGTEVLVNGDTVAAGPTVAGFDMTTQTITTPLVLLPVTLADDTVMVLPCSISNGTVTFLMEPPDGNIPKVGGTVFGSANYLLSEAVSSYIWQGLFTSDTTGHKFRAMGAIVRQMVLNLTAGQLPTVDFETMVNSWAITTKSLQSVSPPPSAPWMNAQFRVNDFGDADHAASQFLAVKGDLAITFQRALQAEMDQHSAEAASGYEDPATENFVTLDPVLPYDTKWRDEFGASNASNKSYHLLAATTHRPGRGCAVYLPKACQTAYPQKVEENGMVRVQPTFGLESGYANPPVFAMF